MRVETEQGPSAAVEVDHRRLRLGWRGIVDPDACTCACDRHIVFRRGMHRRPTLPPGRTYFFGDAPRFRIGNLAAPGVARIGAIDRLHEATDLRIETVRDDSWTHRS